MQRFKFLFPIINLFQYFQATSHLVDICRQIIIFEDMSSLAECLRVIRLDKEASVVRIKNRLDPAYNARLSAGYRDVALNITLANDKTVDMGLEKHVCEVQLILLPMYQLKVSTQTYPSGRTHRHHYAKIYTSRVFAVNGFAWLAYKLNLFLFVQSEEGHSHYVTFRNLRGE
jgi:hypothetical protein